MCSTQIRKQDSRGAISTALNNIGESGESVLCIIFSGSLPDLLVETQPHFKCPKIPHTRNFEGKWFLWSPGCSQKKLALWVSGEFERRCPSSRCPLTQIQGCKENRELGWKIQEHRHLGVGWLKEGTVKMSSPSLGGNRCFPYLLALKQSMWGVEGESWRGSGGH